MKRAITIGLIALVSVGGLAACGSNADTVSKNLSKEAEKFNVQRRIIGINGITDKILFDVEGRCSIETPGRQLQVICKQGPHDYRKHFIGLSDNVTYITTQLEPMDVSEYRTKIIIRPTSVVPDLDLMVGS